jgi:hypothetical protein
LFVFRFVEPFAVGNQAGQMRHVLGIAFSGVDMNANALRELEFLFLRLVYAVLKSRESGDEARGYIVVVRQEARDAVRRLKSVYGAGEEVEVVFASLLVTELARLADAAERVSSGEDVGAEREVAGRIANEALRREISEREPGVAAVDDVRAMPFGVPWDFYGTLRQRPHDRQFDEPISPRLL